MQRLATIAVLLLVAALGLVQHQGVHAEECLEGNPPEKLTGGAIEWRRQPRVSLSFELETPRKFPFDSLDLNPPQPTSPSRVIYTPATSEQEALKRLDTWLAEFMRRYPSTAAAQVAWKARNTARRQLETTLLKAKTTPVSVPRISGDTGGPLAEENRWILQLKRPQRDGFGGNSFPADSYAPGPY